MTPNTELNDLRIIVCLRESEVTVTVERISDCTVIEKVSGHSIHCLPCFCTVK